jgi:MFS family permease
VSPAPPVPPAGRGARAAALAAAFGALFVGTGVNFAFGILFKPILLDLGGPRAALAAAATASLAVNALLQPWLGRLVDRVGPRRTILAGLALMAAGTALAAAVRDVWQLVLLQGVVAAVGYTAAGILPVSVHVTRWFPGGRGFVMAVAACGFSVGQLAGTQLAARAELALGWRGTYLVLAGLLLLALPPLALALREAPPGPRGAPGPAAPGGAPGPGGTPWRMPAFWWLTAGLVGCGFTDFLLTTHLPAFAADRGLAPTVAANAMSLWALANVAGILAAGALAARRGARLALALTYACRAGALLALPLVREPWQLYAFAVPFGATFFTTAPLASTLTGALVGPARHGAAFGAANLFHHLAGAAGALAGGLAFDRTGSYEGIFLAGGLLVVGSAAASLRVGETGPRRPAPAPCPPEGRGL